MESNEVSAEKNIEIKLIFNKIDQLHNITLSFSSQCFELKKMCIITLTALLTIFSKFSDSDNSNLFYNIDFVKIGLAVIVSFHFLDSMTYYYQRKMRKLMDKEEKKLSNIQPENETNLTYLLKECFKSFFNFSQLIYYILYFIFFTTF